MILHNKKEQNYADGVARPQKKKKNKKKENKNVEFSLEKRRTTIYLKKKPD